MDMGLTGRRALITGASTGLGQSIAEMLAAEGASVIVHGRDPARTNAVAAAISTGGGDAVAVLGDLALSAGAAAVAEAVGEIDILVNNAGYYDDFGWSELDGDQWSQIYEVNVVSGVRMIEHLVPGMRRKGGAGSSLSGVDWQCNPRPLSRTTPPRWRRGTTSRCRWPANWPGPESPPTSSHPEQYSPAPPAP